MPTLLSRLSFICLYASLFAIHALGSNHQDFDSNHLPDFLPSIKRPSTLPKPPTNMSLNSTRSSDNLSSYTKGKLPSDDSEISDEYIFQADIQQQTGSFPSQTEGKLEESSHIADDKDYFISQKDLQTEFSLEAPNEELQDSRRMLPVCDPMIEYINGAICSPKVILTATSLVAGSTKFTYIIHMDQSISGMGSQVASAMSVQVLYPDGTALNTGRGINPASGTTNDLEVMFTTDSEDYLTTYVVKVTIETKAADPTVPFRITNTLLTIPSQEHIVPFQHLTNGFSYSGGIITYSIDFKISWDSRRIRMYYDQMISSSNIQVVLTFSNGRNFPYTYAFSPNYDYSQIIIKFTIDADILATDVITVTMNDRVGDATSRYSLANPVLTKTMDAYTRPKDLLTNSLIQGPSSTEYIIQFTTAITKYYGNITLSSNLEILIFAPDGRPLGYTYTLSPLNDKAIHIDFKFQKEIRATDSLFVTFDRKVGDAILRYEIVNSLLKLKMTEFKPKVKTMLTNSLKYGPTADHYIIAFDKAINDFYDEITSNTSFILKVKFAETDTETEGRSTGYNYTLELSENSINIHFQFEGQIIPKDELSITVDTRETDGTSGYQIANGYLRVLMNEYYAYSEGTKSVIEATKAMEGTKQASSEVMNGVSAVFLQGGSAMRSQNIQDSMSSLLFMNVEYPPNYVQFAKPASSGSGSSQSTSGGSTSRRMLEDNSELPLDPGDITNFDRYLSDQNFLKNTGKSLLYLMGSLIIIPVVEILLWLITKKRDHEKTWYYKGVSKASYNFRWSFMLNQFISKFQQVVFYAFLELYNQGRTRQGNILNLFVAMLAVILMCAGFAGMIMLIRFVFEKLQVYDQVKDQKNHPLHDYMQRRLVLHKSFKSGSWMQLLYPFFLMLRSLTSTLAIIFLYSSPAMQLAVMDTSTTLMILYLLIFKPMKNNKEVYLTVGYELLLLFSLTGSTGLHVYSKNNGKSMGVRNAFGFLMIISSSGTLFLNFVGIAIELWESRDDIKEMLGKAKAFFAKFSKSKGKVGPTSSTPESELKPEELTNLKKHFEVMNKHMESSEKEKELTLYEPETERLCDKSPKIDSMLKIPKSPTEDILLRDPFSGIMEAIDTPVAGETANFNDSPKHLLKNKTRKTSQTKEIDNDMQPVEIQNAEDIKFKQAIQNLAILNTDIKQKPSKKSLIKSRPSMRIQPKEQAKQPFEDIYSK